MIDGLSVLALVPARGGSKGIPGKNIIPLGGKPLIAWTIEAARAVAAIDRLIVSTDDEAIASVARGCGCEVPFLRPPELAQDSTAGIDVVLHALDELEHFDIVVLLQPTSPFRTSAHIDEAIKLLLEQHAPSIVSVAQSAKPPEWLYYTDENGRLEPMLKGGEDLSRRQDSKPVFYLNGAIYVARTEWLREQGSFVGDDTVAYVMPAESSIDIDEPWDLQLAEAISAQ